MRVQLLALLGAAALVAVAAPASAHPVEGQLGPTPLCDAVPTTPSCTAVWYRADPEEWVGCLLLADPVTVCADVGCNLSNPPSHCRAAFLHYGFRN